MSQEEKRLSVVIHDIHTVRPSHSGEYLVYSKPGHWLLTTYSTQYGMFGVLDDRVYDEETFATRCTLYSGVLYWAELPNNL